MYLGLGMNTHAACAALDAARIGVEQGSDVGDLCIQLVTTFTNAGMMQNAIEALAYLREEAKRGQVTTHKIARVRMYFDELGKRPALLFVHPHHEEES
jgi:hypothetical protein